MEGKRIELEFPVMRIFIRFSIWCIRMTEGEVRRELVKQLTAFFREVPRRCYSSLRIATRKEYSKADAIQYMLFPFAIKHKMIRWVFYDYLYEDMATKVIKKLLGAKERVA